MSAPVIGVTRGQRSGASFTAYLDAVVEAGGRPQDLYPGAAACADLERLAGTLDGLVLTGGIDVDARLYGQEPHPENSKPEPARDELEIQLARLAVERDLPVFAICRGFQVLNVALGGSLHQHIEGDGHKAYEGEGFPSRFHDIIVENKGALGRLMGGGTVRVNSRHHQGVTAEGIAPGLVTCALSPEDGLIEAYEMPGRRWLLGVQCHPEREEARELFAPLWRDFIAAATRTRSNS
jgi:gamma-glutamyl-gamma-aminobutyrate hydrolase PuuD